MKERLIRILNHYRRGRDYVSLVQSMMIGVIFLEQFDIERIHYTWILPVTCIIFVLIGYFEKSLGLFKKNTTYLNSQNPELMNINHKINQIYETFLQADKTKEGH